MLVAQMTDLHIRPAGKVAYGRVDTNALVEQAIDALAALTPPPDLLVLSGDLTDCGLVEEYEVLKQLLSRLDIPVYLVPGNHDRRENLRQVFRGWEGVHPNSDFIEFTLDLGALRLIGLDTVIPGAASGALCGRRLERLRQELAGGRDRPTLLVMHHPPFVSGIGHMDGMRLLEGAEGLADIVSENPQIERILCGHHHRPIQMRWAGTLVQVAPSVAHQVAFNLSPEGDSAFVMEPPAYLLHAWIEGTGLVSHQAYVGPHPGPFPFVLDPDYPGST